MMNSRSTSRLLGVAAAVCAVIVLATGGVAAAGRKRVVVLEFEGPKGEKFHDDLVRLIKKTHTVVPIEKWNGAAEQLAAGTLSDRDIKKVAHKLKVDAVVEGKIEKRRDEFIIRLKLHEGKTGATIGDTIDTKAEGPRIDGRAQKDLKDELVGAIDNVESNHAGGGGDDEDDAPVRTARKASAGDDDEDEKPAKKAKKPVAAADDEDERPAKKAKKPVAAAEDEDEKPAKKAKKPVAAADDEDEKPAKKAKKPVAAADDEDDRPAKSGFSRRSDDERGGDKVDRKAKKPGGDDDKAVATKPAKKPGGDDDKAVAGKPAKKPGGDDDKAVATKPAKKPGDDDKAVASKPARPTGGDDEPRKVTRATRAGGDADDKARARKVAAADDGNPAEADAEADTDPPLEAAAALSPGERAVDAVVGLSVTMRRMSFAVTQALRATPPGYKGIPVAGAVIDATVYPLALGHTRGDQLKNLGIELIYDRVLKLSSQDPMTRKVYSTIEQRFALHAVFRHTLGHSATPPVVLGTLGFVRQSFNILGEVDIPDVKYSILAPGAGIRFPLSAKLTLGADAKLLAILGTGQIGDPDKYGAASVLGFEGSAGADYQITPRIFARAALRIETIGFTFKGTGEQTNRRDGMPMSQDVFGARDTYFGGTATVGYLY
jgi:hypothetical protein